MVRTGELAYTVLMQGVSGATLQKSSISAQLTILGYILIEKLDKISLEFHKSLKSDKIENLGLTKCLDSR